MLSYHADADIHTNPYELGLGRLVNVDMKADFIGKEALRHIRNTGVARKQVGLTLHCSPLKGPNTTFWEVKKSAELVGKVTSAIYSPRLEQNIALAFVAVDYSELDTVLDVETAQGLVSAKVVKKPFYDPKKKIASKV
jgi:aminomethyltransferase